MNKKEMAQELDVPYQTLISWEKNRKTLFNFIVESFECREKLKEIVEHINSAQQVLLDEKKEEKMLENNIIVLEPYKFTIGKDARCYVVSAETGDKITNYDIFQEQENLGKMTSWSIQEWSPIEGSDFDKYQGFIWDAIEHFKSN